MNKFILRFSYLIVFLVALSAFGWVVKHSVKGDKNFGPKVTNGVVDFVSFFDLFSQTVKEVQNLPETFVKTPDDFTPINNLEEDVWGLVTYSDEDNYRTVELRNFRNDSVAKQWQITKIQRPQNRIMHPVVLPDDKLVYSLNGVTGLICIDANGEEVWRQREIAHHHGLNLDANGNIWACSYSKDSQGAFIVYSSTFKIDGVPMNYIDNTISKVDAETGELLFHKSVSEILHDAKLVNLFLKTGKPDDPIHLNDVEPALTDGPYWDKGDVFLSMRHMSAVIQYRPATDSVIRVLEGPFYTQHDIDIVNDSTLSIFNNNAYQVYQKAPTSWRKLDSMYEVGGVYSNIVYYHLDTDTYEIVGEEVFAENEIHTFTEGLAEHLPTGSIFVEEQNTGILWVIRGDEVLYKGVLPSHHEGYHHLSNWTRIMTQP